MGAVRSCPLPDAALLGKYARDANHTDCYVIDIPGSVSHAEFVEAFYTTWLFRIERGILGSLARRPSTDAQIAALAAATLDEFAAWHVERRVSNQLLLCDFQGRTRSWLMSTKIDGEVGRSRLYFGSAVVARTDPESGESSLGATYRALLVFHKCYSRLLLGTAAARLRRLKRAP
jgi:hypothetical protein